MLASPKALIYEDFAAVDGESTLGGASATAISLGAMVADVGALTATAPDVTFARDIAPILSLRHLSSSWRGRSVQFAVV